MKVIGYVPLVPAAGVPASAPIAAVNVTPVGNAPVSLRVGVGVPVAVTMKDPAVPTINVVLLLLVIVVPVFGENFSAKPVKMACSAELCVQVTAAPEFVFSM